MTKITAFRLTARLLVVPVMAFVLAAFITSAALAQVESTLPPSVPGTDPEGVETLTYGPIHEAFANPTEMDPTPAPPAPMQPPDPVAEEPPEYMPEGAIWIPGYWMWDDDRDEFIWITGVARVPPPGQKWVPGYYTEGEGGWQRVSGFWVSIDIPAVEYRLTPPPETLEVGASSPAPADDYFWVPGNWNYYDTGYRWQAGYWAPYQPDWIWVPARWVWSPAGYVFCDGYWDHRMAYRGQIFAPVAFQSPIYRQPGFLYRPWCVIPTNNLFIHLWIRPQWNCYYFGNYYSPRYVDRGFIPWANLNVVSRQRFIYDPFYSYARVHYHRQGIDYIGRVQGWHRHFADNVDLRPASTWREQQRFIGRAGGPRLETQLVAAPISEIARRSDTAVQLTRLNDQDRRAQQQAAERLRDFNRERRDLERSARLADARLPDRDDPGRGRGRDDGAKGRDDARGRDAVTGAGRQPPRLTLPQDLPGAGRALARGGQQPGEAGRGGRGDRAGGPPATPPPQPRPGRVASDAGKGKAGRDDDRPGRADERGGKAAKAADRVETPPAGRTAETPTGRDQDRDRDTTPGRAPPGREPGVVGREPGGIGRTTPGEERGEKGQKAGRPDTLPDVGRSPIIDRGDKSPTARGKAGDRDIGRPDAADRTPDLGAGRTPPQVDRPGRAAETPRVEGPSRPDLPGREAPRADRPGGGPSLSRPDAGIAPPAGKLSPPTINPDRLQPGGRSDAPGARSGTPRAAPDAGRGRETPPGASPRADSGGGRPTFAPRPGTGADQGRSPLTPRGNAPEARPAPRSDNPAARPPGPRPDPSPRTKAPENRGKDSPPRPGPRPDAGANRVEAFRPSVSREAPAPMPRVQPRSEPKAMPRVEPPAAARAMPRVEPPRENRPAPRIEAPRENRPAPRAAAPRPSSPAPRAEAPRPSSPAPRAEAPRPSRPAPRAEAPRPSRNEGSPGRSSRPEPRAERGGSGGRPAAEVAKAPESSKNKGKSRDRD